MPTENNTWPAEGFELIKDSGFNQSQPTIIFAHAFLQNTNAIWLNEARKKYDALFDNDGKPMFNLFFYDWSKYAQQVYHFAAKWVPNSGMMLGRFIADLNSKLGYSPSKVHVMSYSLSTHVAGQAGRELNCQGLKLGHITAIDPTGVCFHDDTEFGRTYMLQKTDADLVVARHYDLNAYGAHMLIDGLDIFVNGGMKQYNPLMIRKRSVDAYNETDDDPDEQVDDGDEGEHIVGGFLSHWLGTALETSATECESVAYECDSYTEFLAGSCGDCGKNNSKCYYMDTMKSMQMQELGAYQEGKYERGVQMYIEAGKNQKCLYHYQVIARVKPDSSKAVTNAFVSGLVQFSAGSVKTLTPEARVANGQVPAFTTLFALEKQFEMPDFVGVDSKDLANRLEIMRAIESLEIRFMSHPLAEIRELNSAKYCGGPRVNYEGTMQKCSEQASALLPQSPPTKS